MKIGIYDPYLDDLGGGEKYMMTLAECLSKEHNVSVFWDNKTDLLVLKERFSLDIAKITLAKNIFSKSTPFFERVLASRQYDAIILLSDGSIPFLLSKKLYIHIQQPLKQFEKGSLKDTLKLFRVTQFFSNSLYTKSFINRRFNLRTSVIYPPVEAKPKEVKKQNNILHVGRFRVKNVGVDDYKKQQVMINAFKHMVDKGLTNWQFIVATSVREQDLDEFNRVKKSTEKYPIQFLVNKKNDELWEAYSKAKIYWHASGFGENLTLHPEFAEHFGISTVEAMCAGAVPVVINAGGQKEIVRENENGMLWETIAELQAKTRRLIDDEKLLGRLSEEAKKSRLRFSKEMFCRNIQGLIT